MTILTPRLICFDLDGCLVDTRAAITACLNHTLRLHGLPEQPPEALIEFIGPPLGSGFATILERLGVDAAMVATCVAAYREAYPSIAPALTRVVSGIPEALTELACEAPMVVVTSKAAPIASAVVEETGLAPFFVGIHGPSLDVADEPKTVTLGRALHLQGTDGGGSAAMVGDRRHDVEAGRAHGLTTVAVAWGAGDRAELLAAGPDSYVEEPSEMVTALLPSR